MAQEKRYLTNKEAADVIGMSESYLNQDRYVAKASGMPPKFPFIRIGRTIKYDRQVLLQVMAQGMVE
ncbi:helix-turn-helix domain-containing protein [Paracoccus sp. DMF]|uniref:helix-turn-helix domain-containing protein n=1 Tax=Paracoccus sp. DMF TaxID=400837 RepID=UPI0011039F10|nr:helix-turn-helix domain-containing protein [Paracoccus sp. DMF]MCV2446555.1 helix-turn-helix domain-containing protein [Paracoccus sp. DMF]